MSNINRPPLGLLGVTDSQTQGVMPDELLRSVQANVELLPFWLANMPRQYTEVLDVITALGFGTNIVVPEGEMWVLCAAHIQANQLDAGLNGEFGLQVDFMRSGGVIWQQVSGGLKSFQAAGGIGTLEYSAWVPPQCTVFLPSGCAIRGGLTKLTGVPVAGWACVTRATYYRIKT